MYLESKNPAKAIAGDYKVKNGRITSPGKFEGECRYMPYFYEVFLDGVADECLDGSLSVRVEAQDKKNFPELKKRSRVRFAVDNYGAVKEV